MEVIQGKIVSTADRSEPPHEKKIEYFTDPVPVRRHKLAFGAVVVVQTVLSLAVVLMLVRLSESDNDLSVIAERVLTRLLNG